MQQSAKQARGLAVIVVLYNSADVIEACLESILRAGSAISRIVLVDNASPDDSVAVARDTAERAGSGVRQGNPGELGDAEQVVEIVRADANLGFAGGVNIGMDLLAEDPSIGFYWVLNPDCELTPGSADIVLAATDALVAEGGFSLLGTRVVFREGRHIQSDGGVACRWTGRCRNLNQGASVDRAARHADDDCDFISGASMIASREFVEAAGKLPEDYFLYYEEVDWAARRGALPLRRCLDAVVLHEGGTAIGSGAPGRAPSPMSNYFNFRNRMRFMWRYHPAAIPISYAFCLMKVAQGLLRRQWSPAWAAFLGMHGLRPPEGVANAFEPEDRVRAFAAARRTSTSGRIFVSSSEFQKTLTLPRGF